MCNDKDLLVGYVYDDLTSAERTTFDRHLSACASCREEVASLRTTREHLASWAPPDAELGFQIVRTATAGAPRVLPFRSRWMPAFGLAAAAVLVLAAATAIANLEVRYGSDGLLVRTGWARGDAAAPAQAASVPQPLSASGARQITAASRADFELVERRLRDLEAAMASQPATAVARMSDAEMLRQVRALVREAESRQEGAVARRLLQVWQDLDRQRRADLAMMQQETAQYQGHTNAELARIAQTLRVNHLEK